MTTSVAPTGLLRLVVLLVGVHSLLLGLTMLVAPLAFTSFVGFPPAGSAFFPAQAGAFLVALGVCYLLALGNRSLIWTILVSKGVAVVFLFTQALFLGAPPSVLAAGLGDLAMLLATLGALTIERRRATTA